MDVKIKLSDPPQPIITNSDIDATEKIDIENVNMYMSNAMDFQVPSVEGNLTKAHLEVKEIVNAGKKEIVMWRKMTGIDNPFKDGNCTKVSIPNMPDPATLSKFIKERITSLAQEKLTCVGHDGGYDQ